MNYDGQCDKLIFFQFNTKKQKKRGVFAYDPQANTWTTQPIPFPKGFLLSGNGRNSFYSPELNIHFFHVAGDSRDNGVIWAYRHKKEIGTPFPFYLEMN